MFEYVLVQATGRTVRPCTVMVSFLGQLGLISLGVLLPLICTDGLPRARWANRFFAPQPPPAGAATHDAAPLRAHQKAPFRTAASPGRLVVPAKYPDKPALIIDQGPPPDVGLSGGDAMGVPFGLGPRQDGLAPGVDGGVGSYFASPLPPPRVKPPAAGEVSARHRVGGLVSAPKPLRTPRPIYPALARQARISGLVRLEAVIAADGSVRSIRVIQGHFLLVPAAVEAVRAWLYTPPLLNGNPIEVIMQVDVNFQLGDTL
jgi:protein TonB